jgi:hypothetical protein
MAVTWTVIWQFLRQFVLRQATKVDGRNGSAKISPVPQKLTKEQSKS